MVRYYCGNSHRKENILTIKPVEPVDNLVKNKPTTLLSATFWHNCLAITFNSTRIQSISGHYRYFTDILEWIFPVFFPIFLIFILLITLQMIHIHIHICPVRNTSNFPPTMFPRGNLMLKTFWFIPPSHYSTTGNAFFSLQCVTPIHFFIHIFLNSTLDTISLFSQKISLTHSMTGSNMTFSGLQRWNLFLGHWQAQLS